MRRRPEYSNLPPEPFGKAIAHDVTRHFSCDGQYFVPDEVKSNSLGAGLVEELCSGNLDNILAQFVPRVFGEDVFRCAKGAVPHRQTAQELRRRGCDPFCASYSEAQRPPGAAPNVSETLPQRPRVARPFCASSLKRMLYPCSRAKEQISVS